MRAVLQRAREASVTVNGKVVGSIERGIVVLLGVGHDDARDSAAKLARKIGALRIFPDSNGVMNLSLIDVGAGALVVSQFTLMADTRKGNRPSYTGAAPPEQAEALYEAFVRCMCELIGSDKVATGVFRASMDVSLINEGPVTIIVEVDDTAKGGA